MSDRETRTFAVNRRLDLKLQMTDRTQARIADALERIAAALERANDLDPISAIERALQEPATAQSDDDVRPPEWMLR